MDGRHAVWQARPCSALPPRGGSCLSVGLTTDCELEGSGGSAPVSRSRVPRLGEGPPPVAKAQGPCTDKPIDLRQQCGAEPKKRNASDPPFVDPRINAAPSFFVRCTSGFAVIVARRCCCGDAHRAGQGSAHCGRPCHSSRHARSAPERAAALRCCLPPRWPLAMH